MPLTISWSALKSHEECRQKHFLQQTGHRSPGRDLRGFFHGTVADRVMRAWLDQESPELGAMPGMVIDMIDKCLVEAKDTEDGVVRWKGREDRGILTEYVVELVTRLEPWLVANVLPYDYQPEHRFRVPVRIPYLDGTPVVITLIGGIDILVRENEAENVWAAYDLKATKNDQYVKQVLGQGIFYDLAIRAAWGKSPRTFAFVQPMCKEAIVKVAITDDDRRSLMARIQRMAHSMWRKDFDVRGDTKPCGQCPVSYGCSRFSPVGGPTFARPAL